ncbi:MAG: hypothetical protein AABZ74_08195 [Cyanobacteriota bacterium]
MKAFKKSIIVSILGIMFISSCDSTITTKDLKKEDVNKVNKNLPNIPASVVPSTGNQPPIAPLTGIFDLKKATDIVTNKCASCHALKPSADSGYTSAPKNIVFDTPKEIEAQMEIIKKVTFTNKSMPTGKITMTDEERNVIGLFGNQQAVSGKLEIKDAPALIERKCSYCHSLTPDKSSGYSSPADGFVIGSLADMINKAQKIKKETVLKRSMPINPISMTEEERQLIAQWADQQSGGNPVNYRDDD